MDKIPIGGRLHSTATGNVVAGANEIQDDNLNKKQSQINEEIIKTLEIHNSAIEGLNSQNYKSYTATNETTAITDVLPDLGDVNTIYRLGNWDGTQYDTTQYAEYAWINTSIDQGEYVLLDVKNYGIDNEPTAGSDNLVKSKGIASAVSPVSRKVLGGYTLDMHWTSGYINYNGLISSSSVSLFSQPFTLKKGDIITVGTRNTNVCLISTTNTNTLEVGDSVTPIQRTSSIDQFETYSYTAEEDIKLVICVRASEYSLSFSNPNNINNYIKENGVLVIERTLNVSSYAKEIYRDGVKVFGKNIAIRLNSITCSFASGKDIVVNIYPHEGSAITKHLSAVGQVVSYEANNTYIEGLLITVDANAITSAGNIVLEILYNNGYTDYILPIITAQVNDKVDKETGKSLIDETFADDIPEILSAIENPEYIKVHIDKDGRIVEGLKKDGNKYIEVPCVLQGIKMCSIESQQYIKVMLDKNNRVLGGIDKNGKFVYGTGVPESIKKYLSKLKDELSEDIDNVDGIKRLPYYYFENNYIDNKVDYINSIINSCARNGDAFFWITDVHWELNPISEQNTRFSPSLIKYIARKTNINRLLCGGDVTHTGNSKMCIQFLNMCRNAIGSDHVYTALGNHEFISYKSYDEVFHTVFQFNDDVVFGGDATRSCYYVNNNQQKIRYIALGSFGVRNEETGKYESLYNQENLNWFVNEAMNVDSGWTIVIFTHCLYSLTNFTGIRRLDEKDYSLTPIKNNGVWNYEMVGGEGQFIDAIDNYNGNGKIACVLIGHTHFDRIHIGQSGVPYIISASDQCMQTIITHNVPRGKGTINEQHFEIVVIDKNQRKVHIIAVGAKATDGIDNDIADIELVDVREVNYQ